MWENSPHRVYLFLSRMIDHTVCKDWMLELLIDDPRPIYISKT